MNKVLFLSARFFIRQGNIPKKKPNRTRIFLFFLHLLVLPNNLLYHLAGKKNGKQAKLSSSLLFAIITLGIQFFPSGSCWPKSQTNTTGDKSVRVEKKVPTIPAIIQQQEQCI